MAGRRGNRGLVSPALPLLLAVLCMLPWLGAARPAAADSTVSLATGAYVYSHVDMTAPAGATPIRFQHSYNSGDTRVTPLGPGWTHNFDMRVNLDAADRSSYLVVGPQGRTDRYTPNADGTFSPPPNLGIALSFARGANGTFVATQEDGSLWTFDGNGRLMLIDQPGRPRIGLGNGPDGPEGIVVAGGRTVLQLAYDRQTHRLIRVSDVPDPSVAAGQGAAATPREVVFGYDAQGRLETAQDREGQVTRYAYHADTMLLRSLTDALGHVAITIEYDAEGRVSRRADALGLGMGRWTTLTYLTNADGTQSTREQRVPSGFAPAWQPVYTSNHDALGRLVGYVSEPAPGDTPEVYTFTYAPDGQVAGVTRRGGATPIPPGAAIPAGAAASSLIGDPTAPLPSLACPTPLPLPAQPRDLQVISAPLETLDPRAAALQDLVLAVQAGSQPAGQSLDAYGRVVGLTLADGRSWRFQYDREDRLLAVEAPPASSGGPRPGGSGPVTEFRYDAVGNVIEVHHPSGEVDYYQYDERDSLSEARWASGVTARYGYDDRGDLRRAELAPAAGSAVQVVEYAFDGLRRPRRMSTSGGTTSFGYDDAGACTAYRS